MPARCPLSSLLPSLKPLHATRWSAYAQWLAQQANPPQAASAHPLPSEAAWQALGQDFAQCLGLSLERYIRLQRIRHLLSQQRHPHCAEQLEAALLDTPLGPMLAIFSAQGLSLLEFPEQKRVEAELLALQKTFQADFVWRATQRSRALQQELTAYFAGERPTFATVLAPVGTPFQQQVWRQLQTIPYGQTRSYRQQAQAIGKPQAVRAVAAANGQNKISILIPCHRVIGSDGRLTGYAGGLERKKALLDLENGASATLF
ncbi:methylated-DNA--[protein]-cysteine S-methyltransferase [Allofranklinella schreckenbergeri]|uniref:Methylated-DNA--protein-cysteine methyltransferase n=1 Tax=Allofranklinella schreckenbergeri TaxID=1076744 RepID=A0A3M6QT38_9BURK|nr:methylated-DNA--[protein]-cysteine S-methyltransferase [Allofranklinella schreckenbergeri]RMX06195.1 methylated-DNA--[protein]-cysteine S-methyltransferase [Allofranklinella schreckenbergeri]